jgi:hypothetical protein
MHVKKRRGWPIFFEIGEKPQAVKDPADALLGEIINPSQLVEPLLLTGTDSIDNFFTDL